MAVKLTFTAPDGLNDEAVRRKLGLMVGEMIDACEMEKDNFRERWEQVDRAYRNEIEESLQKPWPGAPTYHVPVVQPRIDRGTAFIATPMTSAMPWWLVRAGGPASKRIDQVETALHYHLKKAKYPFHLRQALDLAQLRGKSVLMPYFEAGEGSYAASDGVAIPKAIREKPGQAKKPLLRMRAIDVQDHVVYPNYECLIEDCIMTGHRYEKPLQWVREKITSGDYYPLNVTGGSQIKRGGGDSSLDKNSQGDNSTRPEHAAVEIYQIIAYVDPLKSGKPEWLLMEIYKDKNEILRIEKYRYSRPWYFDIFIKQEYGRYLNENSRGRNLIGPQQFANDCLNMLSWGSIYSMLPAVFGQRWALPEDVSSIKPGMVVPMEGGGQVTTVQGHYDAAAFPLLMQQARMQADDVGGVSAQGMGSPLRAGPTTATESQNAAQGQLTGVEEDAANVLFGLTDMVEFIVGDLLYQHWGEWAPAYQSVLPPTTEADFENCYWFESNGETPLNTPQAVQQQIQGLTQLLEVLGPETVGKIRQIAPSFDMDLVRMYLDATELPGHDQVLPTREEMASILKQLAAQPTPPPRDDNQKPDYDHAGPGVRAQMEAEAGYRPDPPPMLGMMPNGQPGQPGQADAPPDGGLSSLQGMGVSQGVVGPSGPPDQRIPAGP